MNVSVTPTHIGLGFAIQYDPFQSGREAAQMAKSQMTKDSHNLVLAFGPNTIHFQDYIEGVRLVTGENTLIGIPTERVLSNELASPQACVVVIIESETTKLSIAQARFKNDLTAPITSLLTDFRQLRGNTRHQYEHHGLIMLENVGNDFRKQLAELLTVEVGLESWLSKITLTHTHTGPLMCQDKVLPRGMIGIECLSNSPFGLGVVNIGAFKGHDNIYQEAVKTALRDGQTQMGDHPAALGLLFLNFPSSDLNEEEVDSIFKTSHSIVKDIPVVGLISKDAFVRGRHRTDSEPQDSIMALMIPQ